MSTVKCNAKDPSTCRYHRPDAATTAKVALSAAQERLTSVEKRMNDGEDVISEYYDARWEVDNAEKAYYGTEEGIADITKQMNDEADESKKFDLEMKLAAAQFALADAERMNAIDERNGGPLIPLGQHSYEVPTVTAGGNELWPQATGSKYDSSLTPSQIKTKLNADFKEAQKKGYLPKQLKFVSRSRRDVIEVTIVGAADEQIYNDTEEMRRNDYTKPADELLKRVKGMVDAYQNSQYDMVEARTNYTNFWDRVDFETNWQKDLRLEKEAKAFEKREAKKEAAAK